MKKYLAGLTLAALISANAHATLVEQKFNGMFATMESLITAYNGNTEDIDTLANSDLRRQLFISQTVANMFTDKYPDMGQVWRETKGLEDAIGSYRQTGELLDYARGAGADKAKIESLEANHLAGQATLRNYLKSNSWTDIRGGELARLRKIVSATNWSSDAKEKEYIYSAMAKHVGRIASTDWNMDRLVGHGFHDLRKETRFYLLEVSTLQDLIGTTETCDKGPVLPADPKAGGKCLISSCFTAQITKVNEVFSAVKDAGEGAEELGKPLSQEMLKPVKELYSEVRGQKVFEHLTDEYQACARSMVGQ